MRNSLTAVLLVALTGCGVPMLRNAPRFDTGSVALGSAIAASIMTLADPEGYARAMEQAYRDATPIPRPMKVTQYVTEDVLDRLDAQKAWEGDPIRVEPGDADDDEIAAAQPAPSDLSSRSR